MRSGPLRKSAQPEGPLRREPRPPLERRRRDPDQHGTHLRRLALEGADDLPPHSPRPEVQGPSPPKPPASRSARAGARRRGPASPPRGRESHPRPGRSPPSAKSPTSISAGATAVPPAPRPRETRSRPSILGHPGAASSIAGPSPAAARVVKAPTSAAHRKSTRKSSRPSSRAARSARAAASGRARTAASTARPVGPTCPPGACPASPARRASAASPRAHDCRRPPRRTESASRRSGAGAAAMRPSQRARNCAPTSRGLRAVVRAAHGDLAGELEDLLVRGGPIDRRAEDRVQERPASPHRGELDGGPRLGRCPRTQLSDDQLVEPRLDSPPRHLRERARDPQAQRAVDAAELPEQRHACRDCQLRLRVAREDLQARFHAHAPRNVGVEQARHLLGAHAGQLEHGALGNFGRASPAPGPRA